MLVLQAYIEPDLQAAQLRIHNQFNPFSGFQAPTYILKSLRLPGLDAQAVQQALGVRPWSLLLDAASLVRGWGRVCGWGSCGWASSSLKGPSCQVCLACGMVHLAVKQPCSGAILAVPCVQCEVQESRESEVYDIYLLPPNEDVDSASPGCACATAMAATHSCERAACLVCAQLQWLLAAWHSGRTD